MGINGHTEMAQSKQQNYAWHDIIGYSTHNNIKIKTIYYYSWQQRKIGTKNN